MPEAATPDLYRTHGAQAVYPELLTVSAAGDFEGVLSFGIGLAAQGGYHVFTLTGRAAGDDVSHVTLGKFPGIWDITSWLQYWATQYSWLNGHQPWLSSPSFVVKVWAGSYGSASVVRQVSANTFKVTKPDGKAFTVTGVRRSAFPARGSSPRSRRPSSTGFCRVAGPLRVPGWRRSAASQWPRSAERGHCHGR